MKSKKELQPAIIRLAEQGKGVMEIARLLQVPHPIVSKGIKRFRETGFEPIGLLDLVHIGVQGLRETPYVNRDIEKRSDQGVERNPSGNYPKNG